MMDSKVREDEDTYLDGLRTVHQVISEDVGSALFPTIGR
jgi:hypothetical protein